MTAGGAFVRAPVPSTGPSRLRAQPDTEMALQRLLGTGVITQVEFQELRARVIR